MSDESSGDIAILLVVPGIAVSDDRIRGTPHATPLRRRAGLRRRRAGVAGQRAGPAIGDKRVSNEAGRTIAFVIGRC
jgi:hypothetical protein